MNYLPILGLALVFCCAIEVRGAQSDSQFEATITKKVGLRYRITTPEGYAPEKDPQEKYPLIIFLHGRGEQGDNLDRVQIHGPCKKVAELKLQVIVVSPQSPSDEHWQADSLSALTDHLLETLPIDKTRVYLTGLSLGGQGTWRLAIERPEVFAAIAPICGPGLPSKVEPLRDTPIWIFHGKKDNTVRYRESVNMVEALKKIGNEPKFTTYPDARHNSWTETYNNPELYEWMLSHQKKAK